MEMLLLYLQDYDPAKLRELEELCTDSFELDWQTRVAACGKTPSGLLSKVKQADIPSLFILEDVKREQLDIAVAKLREQNALHYLVLRLSSVWDALTIRPPFYRPSGFLVSPINKEALHRILDEIYRDYTASRAEYGGFFSLKIRGTVYKLPYSKILFFESSGKKIIARTAEQEYGFYDSMEEIIRAAPDFFLRTHRSFCVNKQHISTVSFSERCITMQDGSVIPFSRTFRAELEQAMGAT